LGARLRLHVVVARVPLRDVPATARDRSFVLEIGQAMISQALNLHSLAQARGLWQGPSPQHPCHLEHKVPMRAAALLGRHLVLKNDKSRHVTGPSFETRNLQRPSPPDTRRPSPPARSAARGRPSANSPTATARSLRRRTRLRVPPPGK